MRDMRWPATVLAATLCFVAAPHAIDEKPLEVRALDARSISSSSAVEQDVPALVPYLELAEGTTVVATDGADQIEPSADGRSLRAVWRRWARAGSDAATAAPFRYT